MSRLHELIERHADIEPDRLVTAAVEIAPGEPSMRTLSSSCVATWWAR